MDCTLWEKKLSPFEPSWTTCKETVANLFVHCFGVERAFRSVFHLWHKEIRCRRLTWRMWGFPGFTKPFCILTETTIRKMNHWFARVNFKCEGLHKSDLIDSLNAIYSCLIWEFTMVYFFFSWTVAERKRGHAFSFATINWINCQTSNFLQVRANLAAATKVKAMASDETLKFSSEEGAISNNNNTKLATVSLDTCVPRYEISLRLMCWWSPLVHWKQWDMKGKSFIAYHSRWGCDKWGNKWATLSRCSHSFADHGVPGHAKTKQSGRRWQGWGLPFHVQQTAVPLSAGQSCTAAHQLRCR